MNGQNRCHEHMGDGSPCPFEKWNGSLYHDPSHCIFHSEMVVEKREGFKEAIKSYMENIKLDPNISGFDFSRFVFPDYSFQHQQFEKPVNFFQARFLGNADFYGAVFHCGVNFNYCQLLKGGSFRRAIFLKGSDFSNAAYGRIRFEEAEFKGESFFVSSTFLDSADFHGAKFQGTTMFSDATFSKEAIFRETEFEGNVVFERTRFYGLTLFFNSRFNIDSTNVNSQKVDFSRAKFKKEISLQKAEFDIEVDYTGVTFQEDAYFWSTVFKRNVDFMGATFGGKSLFSGGGETKVFYGECYFPRINLGKDAVVTFEDVDLSNAVFLGTNIEVFVFRNVTWHQTKNRRRALLNEFPPTGGGPDPKDYESIAENYRQLVLNYERKRDYEAAEDFHFGEMEMRRKKQNLFGRVPYSVYKYASLYGTSYVRALICLVGFVLLFSLAFLYVGFQTSEKSGIEKIETVEYGRSSNEGYIKVSSNDWLSDYGKSCVLTFSILTFQRERFYEPKNDLGRLLLNVTMVFLTSQAALVLLAIRRRFKR